MELFMHIVCFSFFGFFLFVRYCCFSYVIQLLYLTAIRPPGRKDVNKLIELKRLLQTYQLYGQNVQSNARFLCNSSLWQHAFKNF